LDFLALLEAGQSWIQKAQEVKQPNLPNYQSQALPITARLRFSYLTSHIKYWGNLNPPALLSQEYRVGMRLDACDTSGNWYPATIMEVNSTIPPGYVNVSFDGWSSKWNEWIDVSSARLTPLGTHEYGPGPAKKGEAPI